RNVKAQVREQGGHHCGSECPEGAAQDPRLRVSTLRVEDKLVPFLAEIHLNLVDATVAATVFVDKLDVAPRPVRELAETLTEQSLGVTHRALHDDMNELGAVPFDQLAQPAVSDVVPGDLGPEVERRDLRDARLAAP